MKNSECCPVELYKKYLSHVPTSTGDNAFYLRALPKQNGQIWYYKKAAGREKLRNVVKNIMKKAGLKGHFTNHSSRRSCATRLYEQVPEQVIQEKRGHRSSDGIKANKCTSSSLKRKASELLQGSFCEANMDEECKKITRNFYKNFNESSKMCRSVSREVTTSAEYKTKPGRR